MVEPLLFKDTSWILHMPLFLTPSWSELNYIAMPTCEGGWETFFYSRQTNAQLEKKEQMDIGGQYHRQYYKYYFVDKKSGTRK